MPAMPETFGALPQRMTKMAAEQGIDLTEGFFRRMGFAGQTGRCRPIEISPDDVIAHLQRAGQIRLGEMADITPLQVRDIFGTCGQLTPHFASTRDVANFAMFYGVEEAETGEADAPSSRCGQTYPVHLNQLANRDLLMTGRSFSAKKTVMREQGRPSHDGLKAPC